MGDGPPPQAMSGDGGDSAFSFVVPTEFVELPSQGRFYPAGHPLHGQQTIEIKQMTAKEEDILTSQTLLKNGVALERVISNLIVDKNIRQDDLLVGDRNAIMIAARISGYGSEYNTKTNCPSCRATQPYSFDLHECTIVHGEPSEALGVKEIEPGIFTTILPKTQFEVTFRLLMGRDEKVLMKQLQNARKRKKQENAITRSLRMITIAVNGDHSPQAINYFVENVPSLDARHLQSAYKIATPNVDLTQFFNCSECGYEEEMEVPLTADFFWPKR
jgi:hypothetical protein|tara:strand:+ start:1283 stop:2104 length:822 start_codon:yes stop_codon:yes gene_type:complete